MKVLITGANGFIGKQVSDLLSKDHIVQKITRNDHGDKANIVLDLSKPEAVEQALAKDLVDKPSVVIHLASAMASPETIYDLEILYNNLRITQSVARICSKLQVKKLVHISSMAVYPNVDGTYSEDSTVDPSKNNDCLYGLSKLNAEVLFNFLLANSGIIISHLRLAMVYGEGMNESRIIPVMQKELREKGTITVFGNGERLLNQLSVDKAADIIKEFVEHDYPGVYNIGDETLSTGELAQRINNGKGTIIKIEKGNKAKFRLSISKMRNLLGNG